MASPTAFTASLSLRALGVGGVPCAPGHIRRGAAQANVTVANEDMVLPPATGAPPG